jgi:YD repeat-containing protein
LPCLEIDGNTSLYSSAVTRTFYDSLGRNVETIAPGPDATHSLVTFTWYNDATHSVFKSLPFRVASRTAWLDPNGATDDTNVTPGGTMTVLDALGRTISVTDPLSHQSTTTYGLGSVNGDSATYALEANVDENQHVQLAYIDALGRTRYAIDESGKGGGTLTPVKKQATQYNALDKATSVAVTDLVPQVGQTITTVTTSAQYDDLGRMTSLNDPDRGTHTYTYDADDHALTDISGTHIIGVSYDLLGRMGCIQDAAPATDGSGTCSSGSHPLVQNSYDSSVLGTAGTSDFPVGILTQSVATTYYDPADLSNKTVVTEQYQHDKRGRLVTTTLQVSVPSAWGVTTALPTYKQTQTYNTADQAVTTQTTVGTSTGSTFSNAYDSTTGLLAGLSNTTTSTANLATQSYNVYGLVSDINFQATTGTQLATEHFDVDGNLRPAATAATWQSGSGSSGTIFSEGVAYDAVGNVISTSLTHATVPGQTSSGGSETQNFCYDEQNQLLWAGNSGTQPAVGNGTCGNNTLANTISGAGYSNMLPNEMKEPIITEKAVAFRVKDGNQDHTKLFHLSLEELIAGGSEEYQGYLAWNTLWSLHALLVIAVLTRLKYYFPEIRIGTNFLQVEDMQDGILLCKRVFGIGRNPMDDGSTTLHNIVTIIRFVLGRLMEVFQNKIKINIEINIEILYKNVKRRMSSK